MRERERDGWEHMVKNKYENVLLERQTSLDVTKSRVWPWVAA